MQPLTSAGTCGLGKGKEEINDCTINQKVPDKLSGQIQVYVTAPCTQTSGDREWFVQCFTPHSPQLPKASFTGEKLTKDTGVDPVSAQISVKLSATDRGKTCRTEVQEENVKSTCGLIDWGCGVGGSWSPNILKSAFNCSTNTAVQCFCMLICQ